MKFKKIILGTFLISTAIIVPIVTIAVMSSKHSSNFRTMTIYGAENLSEIADSPGSANFQAINYVGDDVTNDSTWSVSASGGTKPEWINMSATNKGQLVWSANAVPGTYDLTISCSKDGLSDTAKSLILTIVEPAPTPSNIQVFGANNLLGVSGSAGNGNFQATDNTGSDITNSSVWKVEAASGSTKPDWISMSTTMKGQLVWTTSATTGTYQLVVTCSKDGLTNGTKNVTLSIVNPAPTPTSVHVYGADNLSGLSATAGSANFQAIDDTGNNITNTSEWKVEAASGSTKPDWISMSTTTKGQLVWTTNATIGTYKLIITCTKNGLTNGTKNIMLSIVSPTPTPTSIQVYGADNLFGLSATADSANFQAVDDTGNNITNTAEWKVEAASGSTKPNWISMSTTTKGQIVWTNSATVGTYQLVITCTKAGLTNGTKNITLSITNPTPTPSSIQVYGTNSLLGINATAGSGNFQAIDNTGSDITSSGEWKVEAASGSTKPNWIDMSSTAKGQLVWSASAVAGTYQLVITCSKTGLSNGTKNVTLTIANSTPTPTSIHVYGGDNLSGVANTGSNANFQAVDDTGNDITNSGEWKVEAASGSTKPNWIDMSSTAKGQLVWSASAVAGTYQLVITCSKTGLSNGTKNVTLTIVSPAPTPSEYSPVYCNKKYSSESSSSIVLAQNETRDIMFNTSVSSTNKNLLYSYLLTGSAPNITINNFTSFVDDTTYGSSGKLNISANATMSSYANVLMIYVFDTKSAQVGYTTYPLTISIVQNPT